MINTDRILERLAALELTPNAASQKAGLGRDYVRDILRGRIKQPSALRLRRLADALETTPNQLMDQGEAEWSIDTHPEPDDRSYSLAEQMKDPASFLDSEGPNFVSSFFNLMDSVDDKEFVDLAHHSIYLLLGTFVRSSLEITDKQSIILIGDDDNISDDGSFERRAILSLALGRISKNLYASAISLSRFWTRTRNLEAGDVFSNHEAEAALETLLRANGIAQKSGAEVKRLAIIGTVARFTSSQSDQASAAKSGTPKYAT